VSGLLDRWVRVGLVTVVGSMAVAVSLGMTPIQFGAGAPDAPSVETLGQFGRQHPRGDEQSTMTREMQRNQAKRLSEQRQQQVLSDTARLLKLATDLKAEVDKREPDPSPVAVIKEADEIGKLAKRVSDKIKAQ
jgi:hypothetical protein